jgi:hypothetical protein
VISKRTTFTWPMPKAKVDQAIRAMVRRIVAEFDPEQIILYGSRARGDSRPDSDIGIRAIMPPRALRKRGRSVGDCRKSSILRYSFSLASSRIAASCGVYLS